MYRVLVGSLLTLLLVGCAGIFHRSADSNYGMITGVVTDSATAEPIIGAAVMLVGTRYGALTNPDGEFHIRKLPPGRYVIHITHLDYKTTTIPGDTAELIAGQTVRVNRQMTKRETEYQPFHGISVPH